MGGKLYAIVGQVGSGKSSVISAILGEMEKVQGDVKLKVGMQWINRLLCFPNVVTAFLLPTFSNLTLLNFEGNLQME